MQDKLTPPEGYVVRYNTQTGQPYYAKKEKDDPQPGFETRQSVSADVPPAPASVTRAVYATPDTAQNTPVSPAFGAQSPAAGQRPAPPRPQPVVISPTAPRPQPVTHYASYTYRPGEMLPGASAALRNTDAALPAAPPAGDNGAAEAYGPGCFAGFFTRLAAFLVDSILAGLLSLVGGWAFGGILSALGADTGAYVLFHFTAVQIFRYLLTSAYFVVLTALTGYTAGKKLLRIRVVRADGEKLGWWTALYRETIGRYLTSLLCIGYLVLAFDGKHRGFHDMLCDTRVVFAEKAPRAAECQTA